VAKQKKKKKEKKKKKHKRHKKHKKHKKHVEDSDSAEHHSDQVTVLSAYTLLMIKTCQFSTKCMGNKLIAIKWQISLW